MLMRIHGHDSFRDDCELGKRPRCLRLLKTEAISRTQIRAAARDETTAGVEAFEAAFIIRDDEVMLKTSLWCR